MQPEPYLTDITWVSLDDKQRAALKFQFIEAISRAKELTSTQRLLGIVLISYIRHKQGRMCGLAWPGQECLARDLGLTERTVRRATEMLESTGWYVRQRRKSYRYLPNWSKATRDRTPRSGYQDGRGDDQRKKLSIEPDTGVRNDRTRESAEHYEKHKEESFDGIAVSGNPLTDAAQILTPSDSRADGNLRVEQQPIAHQDQESGKSFWVSKDYGDVGVVTMPSQDRSDRFKVAQRARLDIEHALRDRLGTIKALRLIVEQEDLLHAAIEVEIANPSGGKSGLELMKDLADLS